MPSRGNLPIKIIGFKGNPGFIYFLSYNDVLLRVLRACDTAINKSAFGSKQCGPTNQLIEDAIQGLFDYGKEFHLR